VKSKQIIGEIQTKNIEIQTEIRETQTKNERNPKNKKTAFCLDFP
jgi:hypothetical protein